MHDLMIYKSLYMNRATKFNHWKPMCTMVHYCSLQKTTSSILPKCKNRETHWDVKTFLQDFRSFDFKITCKAEEMFSRYLRHSDLISMFKSSVAIVCYVLWNSSVCCHMFSSTSHLDIGRFSCDEFAQGQAVIGK